MDTSSASTKTEVFLESDREVPGQKYVCLSFISPEKVLASKDAFFFSQFVKDVEVQHKIEATEKFLMSQLQVVEKQLSALQDTLQDTLQQQDKGQAQQLQDQQQEAQGESQGQAALAEGVAAVRATRAALSTSVIADLQAHVKEHMSDFRATTIEERYTAFMAVNRKRLEGDFHEANEFRTTVRGIKVRGSFESYPEAAAKAKALQKSDPAFSVYVGQVGSWLPWDPEPAEVAEAEYADEQLNTLMKKYRENEQKREEFFEEQKKERMAAARAAGRKQTSETAPAASTLASAPATSNAAAPSDMFTSGAADEVMARKAL